MQAWYRSAQLPGDLNIRCGTEGAFRPLSSFPSIVDEDWDEAAGSWQKVFDKGTGFPYYFNKDTQQTSWLRPY